jgi:hypothetical protein
MRKRVTPEVREAIWAMLCSGHRDIAIREALERGEAGIEPFKIAPRTYFEHKRAMIEERGRPELAIRPGDEETATDAMRRRALELAGVQLRRLETRAKRERLTTAEIKELRGLMAMLDDAKRRARLARTGDKRGAPDGDTRAAGKKDLLRRLVRMREEMGDRADSPTHKQGEQGGREAEDGQGW